jgi:hypothetical protein
MIKIFVTVRNRLAITKKCFEALRLHTKTPFQLYVYNNQTNYLIEEHFNFFNKLYRKGLVTQVVFNTNDSTFNAFSKAAACNMFGLWHEQDPLKDNYNFLLIMDNDIIVTPDWDLKVSAAWKHVTKNKMNHIKIIGQLPGGIKSTEGKTIINDSLHAASGRLGGSGFWSVRSNFFSDVGYLDLKQLVGHNKRHDQLYWAKLGKSTNGQPYILGLKSKLAIHCGKFAGSVCNRLTSNRNNPNKEQTICFEESEEKISKMTFAEFYNNIENDKTLLSDW